jgi:hypothetical protein
VGALGERVPRERAQGDLWFPAVDILQTRQMNKLPVLMVVTGYSWVINATMMPSRQAEADR